MLQVALVIRFIPTHVGNTEFGSHSARMLAVHPHACGEHNGAIRRLYQTSGSSPRMWGTHTYVSATKAFGRFIPTHVGNTLALVIISLPIPVHPHACGEHGLSMIHSRSDIGSSPRMWGTHPYKSSDNTPYRFIPTHVGNTAYDPIGLEGQPVHPHACGEH